MRVLLLFDAHYLCVHLWTFLGAGGHDPKSTPILFQCKLLNSLSPTDYYFCKWLVPGREGICYFCPNLVRKRSFVISKSHWSSWAWRTESFSSQEAERVVLTLSTIAITAFNVLAACTGMANAVYDGRDMVVERYIPISHAGSRTPDSANRVRTSVFRTPYSANRVRTPDPWTRTPQIEFGYRIQTPHSANRV